MIDATQIAPGRFQLPAHRVELLKERRAFLQSLEVDIAVQGEAIEYCRAARTPCAPIPDKPGRCETFRPPVHQGRHITPATIIIT